MTGLGRQDVPVAAERRTRVLRQFRIVFNAVKTHFQQAERWAGLGGTQLWAVAVVADQPGIGIKDLALTLNVRQPTASKLVKALARHGLLEARREGPDRRAVQLHATIAGRRALSSAPGPVGGVLPSALCALDRATLGRLERELGQIVRHLGPESAELRR